MLLLLLAPLLAATPADALGAWHTRYAILGKTGPYDFLRTRFGCLVGVPREGGPTVLRCGGNPVPDAGQTPPADIPGLIAKAAEDKRLGWAVKRTPTWVGTWREVTLLEFVPTRTEGSRGGRAAEGAAAWDGATGVYGWERKLPPPLANAQWIDWRPPPDLDGTFLTIGPRSLPNYAQPKAELDAAIQSTVGRYLRGEPLPTDLAEVPGGPLPHLPPTRFAFLLTVFLQSGLEDTLGLSWDFRELDVPVALLDQVLRFESRLPGGRTSLLITVTQWGARFELGAAGRPCSAWTPRACRRPADTVESVSASLGMPVRREGSAAALDGELRDGGTTPDSALAAGNGAWRREWILGTQLEPSPKAWRGSEPLVVIAHPKPPPRNPSYDPYPPPPEERFAVPAAAVLTGARGRWTVHGRPSVFPLDLDVTRTQAVTLESVAFYGDSPPFPDDEGPGPPEVTDARKVKGWTWRFTGERPRWVRLRWMSGVHVLATAILPV